MVSVIFFLYGIDTGRIMTVLERPRFQGLLFCIFAMNLLLGSLLSFISIKIQLKPFHELEKGMKKLFLGDFSTRLSLSGKFVPIEFSELIKCFNRMAQELEGTELLRKDFINNFSHEFKTPIVSIRGFAKILQSNTATKQEQKEYLDIIVQESERLSQLSSNVLLLCKIENQSIISDTQTYNLSEQIRQTVLLLENQWEKKNLSFEMEVEEVTFDGSKELLGQMWLNLIDNAIKFSPKGDVITIRLRKKTGNMTFSITDYGDGLTDETKQHIFEKFYQGDSSHTTQGNGIGLSIVKSIAELHEGTVEVESEIGMGTTFTVNLPVKK